MYRKYFPFQRVPDNGSYKECSFRQTVMESSRQFYLNSCTYVSVIEFIPRGVRHCGKLLLRSHEDNDLVK